MNVLKTTFRPSFITAAKPLVLFFSAIGVLVLMNMPLCGQDLAGKVQVKSKGVNLCKMRVTADIGGRVFSRTTDPSGIVKFDFEDLIEYEMVEFEVFAEGMNRPYKVEDKVISFMEEGINISINRLDGDFVVAHNCLKRSLPIHSKVDRINEKIDSLGSVLDEIPDRQDVPPELVDSLMRELDKYQDSLMVLEDKISESDKRIVEVQDEINKMRSGLQEFALVKMKKLRNADFTWEPQRYYGSRYRRVRFVDGMEYLKINLPEMDKDVPVTDSLFIQMEYIYLEERTLPNVDKNGNIILGKRVVSDITRKIIKTYPFKINEIGTPLEVGKLPNPSEKVVAICCILRFGKRRFFVEEQAIYLQRNGQRFATPTSLRYDISRMVAPQSNMKSN